LTLPLGGTILFGIFNSLSLLAALSSKEDESILGALDIIGVTLSRTTLLFVVGDAAYRRLTALMCEGSRRSRGRGSELEGRLGAVGDGEEVWFEGGGRGRGVGTVCEVVCGREGEGARSRRDDGQGRRLWGFCGHFKCCGQLFSDLLIYDRKIRRTSGISGA
jgi:hypothetical protein